MPLSSDYDKMSQGHSHYEKIMASLEVLRKEDNDFIVKVPGKQDSKNRRHFRWNVVSPGDKTF